MRTLGEFRIEMSGFTWQLKFRTNMKCIPNREKNPFIHFSIALAEAAFDYGRNIGIAFQLVDDILDFEARQEGNQAQYMSLQMC